MAQKIRKSKSFKKIVDELFPIKEKYGGGQLKIEAWEDSHGNIVKYSMAYINHAIFTGDSGRVIGYDNTHNYHHRHYFGEIFPVEDFATYEDITDRFEKEVREIIKCL
jgi:hypothetical protein